MAVTQKPQKDTSPIARRQTTTSLSSLFSPPPHLSESMMEEEIRIASIIIMKWDPNGFSYTKFSCLFQESPEEAKQFLKCVNNLCKIMHFLISKNSSSDKLVLMQNLTQTAMKRLEKEFFHILSDNRQYLSPESVSSRSSCMSDHSAGADEEVQEASESMAMSDLKSIADCMISCGYGRECVKIYKTIRKSIVDEELYGLRIERYTPSKLNKMSSQVLDSLTKNWLNAAKVAVQTVFTGERFLCDNLFSASDMTRESCFAHILKDGAVNLFKFPELVAKARRYPDEIFNLIDLYESISDLRPEIESIFSFESISAAKIQAFKARMKLGDSVRTILLEFESKIQKYSSKTPIPGGGIHPLNETVMNYLSLLASRSQVLADIAGETTTPPLPESYFSDGHPTSPVSVRLAWIILVLLCKIDSKAELYNNVSLSYLFLANNLQFVVEKVRTTGLKDLLGEEWVWKHEEKVKLYAANFEATAWSKVYSSLPENPTSTAMSPEQVKGCFRQFSSAFMEVYQKQTAWVLPDRKLRDEIKVGITRKIVPAYREFYNVYSASLSTGVLAPDDLGNYLSDLFHGTAAGSACTPSSSSTSSSSSRSSRPLASQCLPTL